jgi:hypothetical protein
MPSSMEQSSTPSPTAPAGQAFSQDIPPTDEMISGTTKVIGQASPDEGNKTKSTACPKLDSQLNQVLASTDPLSTAKQMKMNVNENKVQVVIVLSSQNIDFLQDYEVAVGVQSGSELQAFVALNQICEISSRDEVLAIRLPAAGVTP